MASSKVRVCLASWLAICGLAVPGCDDLLGKRDNAGYCASPPCPPPDTGGCTSNTACTVPGASVCDTGSQLCVQCTAAESGACTGTAPVCGADDACRACAAHSECASNACSPIDGSCIAPTAVAYVDATGTDNSTCGQMAPCASVAAALAALTMTRQPYIKIHGTIDGEVVIDKGRMVTLLADPGATLTRTAGNTIVTVKDAGSSLVAYDVTFSGAKNPAVGVSVDGGGTLSLMRATVSGNEGGGIAVGSGTLQIDHSAITANGTGNPGNPGIRINSGSLSLAQSMISGNLGGGITVGPGPVKFAIVSNKFVSNGSGDPPGSSTGAVNVQAPFDSSNLLEFNTFYKNRSADGFASALQCTSLGFTARANIMFKNGTGSNLDQTGGNCMHIYSLATPGAVPTGTNNQGADPMFMNADGGDFHLGSGSPAAGAANDLPLVDLDQQDFDGQPRAKPVNLGALQSKPVSPGTYQPQPQ